jgi:hypothetical protein
MARTFERQVVELHVRVALLNRFTQLGRPATVPVVAMAQLRLGLGPPRSAFDLCNKAVVVSLADFQPAIKQEYRLWSQIGADQCGATEIRRHASVTQSNGQLKPLVQSTPRPECPSLCAGGGSCSG